MMLLFNPHAGVLPVPGGTPAWGDFSGSVVCSGVWTGADMETGLSASGEQAGRSFLKKWSKSVVNSKKERLSRS